MSCGGKAGVSDSPAAAVWAVRFLLAAIETGFGEVRFHLSGNPYDPFYLRGGEVVRRPIEGGARLRAAVAGAGGDAAVRARPRRAAWGATVSAPGAESLLILDNESPRPAALILRGASVRVVQSFSPGAAQATLGAPPHGTGKGSHLVRLPANGVLALRFAP